MRYGTRGGNGYNPVTSNSTEEVVANIPDIELSTLVEAGSDAGNKETQLTVTPPSVTVTAVIS